MGFHKLGGLIGVGEDGLCHVVFSLSRKCTTPRAGGKEANMTPPLGNNI
jgi:hypothetical protein